MKVLIVGHSYLALENRKNLEELGKYFNLQVASPSGFKGMIFNYDVENKIVEGINYKIFFLKKVNFPILPEMAYFLLGIKNLIKGFNPDIIHIETDPFNPIFIQSFFWAKLYNRKVKVVSTIKQNTYTSKGFFYDHLKNSLAKIISKKVDHFIAVNEGVKSIYITLFKVLIEKISINTHLGIDTSLFKRNNTGQFQQVRRIGYCGRIIEYKGIFDLIEAVLIINEKYKQNIQLVLLGDGPDKEKVEDLCKKFNWLELKLPVSHNKVPEFLDSIDVFVMPSRIYKEHVEHDSHALLEAMACEVPCIASNSGSNEEVLKDNGKIFKAGSIKQLEANLIEFISNEHLRKTYAKRGRIHIQKKYSIEAVANINTSIYNGLF